MRRVGFRDTVKEMIEEINNSSQEYQMPVNSSQPSSRKFSFLIGALVFFFVFAFLLYLYFNTQNKSLVSSDLKPSDITGLPTVSSVVKNENIDSDTPLTLTQAENIEERIIVKKEDGFYSISKDTTKQAKLAEVIKVSKDHKRIFFNKDNNLWIANIDGTNPFKITSLGSEVTKKYAPVGVSLFAISPAFDALLYTYSVGGMGQGGSDLSANSSVRYGLYLFDFKTGHHTFLASNDAVNKYAFLAWSKQEGVILINNNDFTYPDYARYSLDLTNGNIYLIQNAKPLPGLYGLTVPQVKYNSTIDKIVYSAATSSDSSVDRLVSKNSSRIAIADLNGNNYQEVSPVGMWTTYQWPDFSPDGQSITYNQKTGITGKSTLFKYEINTKQTQRLTDHYGQYMWLDKAHILAGELRGGQFAYNAHSLDIYVIDIQTQEKKLFLQNAYIGREYY